MVTAILRTVCCPLVVWAVVAASSTAQEAVADAPRTVVVNVVAFSTSSSGKAQGSCTPVSVTAGGSGGGQVRVGFFETEVGGTGAQWRSAGWMAAVTAALFSDLDPRAMRVSFEYEGRVDGPSAGGLMTIGVLAAVRGDTPRPDAAMTGTINPDGSLGPVGGIAQKIEGAAAKGMKLVLIPAGIRFDRDGNTGEQVDLIEHGKALGVEVQSVFDIYSAYKALTGVELPRAPAAASPKVGLAAQQQVQEKMGDWHQHYAKALDTYYKMPGTAKLSQEIVDVFRKGVEILNHSDQLKTEGEFTAAFRDRVRATAYGYLALEIGRCRQAYAAGGYRGVVARLRDNAWLEADVRKTAARMREDTPKTLDQLSMYLIACDTFLEALSLQLLAKATLANLPDAESEYAILQAADAAQNQIVAWLDLKLTRDYLDLAQGYEGMSIPTQAPWRQTADYLRRASGANLAVFEALIVEPRAKAQAQSVSEFKTALMQKDKIYAILIAANEHVFPRLGDYFGEGDAAGYAYLASSIYTHTRAAGLVAKYYSLGAELDAFAQVTKLARERTLGEWLAFAEDQSRRNIAELQARGIDATPSAQMHEVARINAGRDVNDKLDALVQFWSADMHAQVLRRIAGAPAKALEAGDDSVDTPAGPE